MGCKNPLVRLESTRSMIQAQDGHLYGKAIIFSQNDMRFRSYEYYQDRMAHEIRDPGDTKTQLIPCGKCIGCRLDYSKMWATRCTMETLTSQDNYFVTLTYNDDNLPVQSFGQAFSKYTGEIYEVKESWQKGTLVPEDLTRFLKTLRKYFERKYNHTGIRFYACGEYGETYERPHYHLILFNCPIPKEELYMYKVNANHQPLYKWDKMEQDLWGKGFVDIGEVTWSSCAYVARYILKKQGGEASDERYAMQGRIPEFVRMSRMPGIGREYFETNKDLIYQLDEILVKTVSQNILKVKPPKYYDQLYDIINHEKMQAIKDDRRIKAIEATKVNRLKTTKDQAEQYDIEARTLAQKISKLIRPVG